MLDYIGTLPEAPVDNGKTLSLNPQSRYQVTENIANQTEAIYKFNVGGWKNTALGRCRNLARDRQHRQICGPQFGSAAGRHSRR